MNNFEIYLVGGAVRDELMGLPVKERDWVVVGATESDMLKNGFQKVGKDFPVFLHPKTHEEYALARTERKTDKGYYGFECEFSPSVTLEDDLKRRDLTVNAIAKAADGKFIDPFNGQQDIQNKTLRHISTAFSEDPVRILRIGRFMARFFNHGFKVAVETEELMNKMVLEGEVASLVPERVWKEMSRALAEPTPVAFVETLRSCDALKIIFPELDRLWGIPQNPVWHPEIDTGKHVMMALEKAAEMTEDPIVRFAVLCHDLGKGNTPQEMLPSHKGHEERGAKLLQSWCKKYRVPNVYKDLALKVARWHLHSHRALELNANELVKLLRDLDVFRNPEKLDLFLLACEADFLGRGGEKNNYDQKEFIKKAYEVARKVDVQLLIADGFTGKELGEKLKRRQAEAIEDIIVNKE